MPLARGVHQVTASSSLASPVIQAGRYEVRHWSISLLVQRPRVVVPFGYVPHPSPPADRMDPVVPFVPGQSPDFSSHAGPQGLRS